jgi:hypothetical protein
VPEISIKIKKDYEGHQNPHMTGIYLKLKKYYDGPKNSHMSAQIINHKKVLRTT